jgi:uncharacterized protein (TIGR01569 family)
MKVRMITQLVYIEKKESSTNISPSYLFSFVIILKAMLALVTAGASAAAAIVYLAHKGNVRANWLAICQQFDSFCERISGSLIGSFGAVVVLILLILLSAIALARR